MCATQTHRIEEGREYAGMACISFYFGLRENLKRIFFVNKHGEYCTIAIAKSQFIVVAQFFSRKEKAIS